MDSTTLTGLGLAFVVMGFVFPAFFWVGFLILILATLL